MSLTQQGDTLVDSKKVETDETVLQLAREARQKHVDVRAVIQADAAVPHGRVVRTMDLLRQGGIGKVAFGAVTIPPEPKTPSAR